MDNSLAAYIVWAHSNRWLGLRLDLIGALIIFLTALLCVVSNSIGPGQAGLLLTYAITLTRCLAVAVRATTQLEVQVLPHPSAELLVPNPETL